MQNYLLQFSGETEADWKQEAEILRNRRRTYAALLLLRGFSADEIQRLVDERYPNVLDRTKW